jgi:xylan 1,4-beta-xylosidase
MGVQWSFHAPKRDEGQRASYGAGGLTIAASGRSPADSSPLTCLVGDRGYQAEVSIDLTGKVEAGFFCSTITRLLSAWASRLRS